MKPFSKNEADFQKWCEFREFDKEYETGTAVLLHHYEIDGFHFSFSKNGSIQCHKDGKLIYKGFVWEYCKNQVIRRLN